MKNKIDMTNGKVVFLAAGLCCFLWGSAAPAIKIGYSLFRIDPADTASILVFAGVRFMLAGFLVIAYHSLTQRHWIMPPKGSGGAIASLALTQTVLQYLFYYVGLSRASGVHSAIITGTNVFFSMLCASLVFGYEKLDVRKITGCILGFLGISIVNLAGAGPGQGSGFSFLGEGFVMLAQIFYALSGSLIKKHARAYDVVTLSGYQFMAGGLGLWGIGLVWGGTLSGAVGPSALALLLYMVILSAVAYTLWGVLLKYNPVSQVTVYGFMNPMFGVLLSAVFLKESGQALSWTTLVALILVCLGIYVVNREKGAARSR
ncbi:MAG: DMT family transporter [Lachnospiraceae bacterium]|jgi:drug/metabolite transporter (DMT)-like permease|nr:DMT family transporter [Lachnospiraceae bacterium]